MNLCLVSLLLACTQATNIASRTLTADKTAGGANSEAAKTSNVEKKAIPSAPTTLAASETAVTQAAKTSDGAKSVVAVTSSAPRRSMMGIGCDMAEAAAMQALSGTWMVTKAVSFGLIMGVSEAIYATGTSLYQQINTDNTTTTELSASEKALPLASASRDGEDLKDGSTFEAKDDMQINPDALPENKPDAGLQPNLSAVPRNPMHENSSVTPQPVPTEPTPYDSANDIKGGFDTTQSTQVDNPDSASVVQTAVWAAKSSALIKTLTQMASQVSEKNAMLIIGGGLLLLIVCQISGISTKRKRVHSKRERMEEGDLH